MYTKCIDKRMIFKSIGCPVRVVTALHLSNCPIWQVVARLVVVALSKCAHSSLIDSSTAVFALHSLALLLYHLLAVYDISNASDLPDPASTCPCHLVGPPAGTDTSRLQSVILVGTVGLAGLRDVCGRWEVVWMA